MKQPIIDQIAKKDVLLSYPYESMHPFIKLLNEAGNDDRVLSIKMTLYRVAKNSQIVEALIEAAENGKEVVVLVELRARFDEENNIEWSRRLEEAGCKIIYGIDHIKVHSKQCLITYKDGEELKNITHVGTGNFNEKTAKLYTDNFYYDYNNLQSETTTFSVKINEIQEELILKENEVTLTIPKLNEYSPLDVKCTNSNVESEYDESTGVLKIKRSSKIDENGIVTDALSRYNTYTVSVTYPKEAYEKITSYTELHIPVSGYYTGYNNKNEQFQNPYQSNIENGIIVVFFRETQKGKIYNFYVDFMDKQTVYQPYKRSVISKQDILNLYDREDSVKSKEYTVRWTVSRGSEGEVPSIIMSETKKDDNYGDKWGNLVMHEYSVNFCIR